MPYVDQLLIPVSFTLNTMVSDITNLNINDANFPGITNNDLTSEIFFEIFHNGIYFI